MKVASEEFDNLSPELQQRIRSAAKLLATGAIRAAAKAANEDREPDKDCGFDTGSDPQ